MPLTLTSPEPHPRLVYLSQNPPAAWYRSQNPTRLLVLQEVVVGRYLRLPHNIPAYKDVAAGYFGLLRARECPRRFLPSAHVRWRARAGIHRPWWLDRHSWDGRRSRWARHPC